MLEKKWTALDVQPLHEFKKNTSYAQGFDAQAPDKQIFVPATPR
jgi:hypothetical protein